MSTLAAAQTLALGLLITLVACGGGSGDETGNTGPQTGTGSGTQGAISLSTGGPTLSVAQGGSGSIAVTVARSGGFTGSVSLAVTGLPAGVTATLSPTSIASGSTSATIALAASSSAAVGNTTITIHATGSGVSEQTASVVVTVTAAAGSGGTTTTYTFCAGSILFAAYQDGTGPWTKASPSGNSVTFKLSSGRGGVAFVIPIGATSFTTYVYYGTQSELNTGALNCTPSSGKTVTGSVAGLGATDVAFVGFGGGVKEASPAAPNFTITSALDGSRDLIAARLAVTITPFSEIASKVIIRRGLNPSAGAALPVLDFTAAEAVTPVMHTFTATNLGSDVISAASESYQTSTLSTVPLYSQTLPSGNSAQFPTLPNPQAGDLNILEVTAEPDPRSPTTSRDVFTAFAASADQTVAFNPPIGAATVTAASTSPSARLRVQYTPQPEYSSRVTFQHSATSGGTTRGIGTFFLQGYLAGLTTLDYTEPDFSALAGWNSAWAQPAGVATQWALIAQTFSEQNALLSKDGDFMKDATRIGTITP